MLEVLIIIGIALMFDMISLVRRDIANLANSKPPSSPEHP